MLEVRPRPLVIAHRGASRDKPENTVAAFHRAIEAGADFVELDVHATADGELIVVHDRPSPGVQGMPSLEQVVGEFAGQIGIMAELKQPHRYRRHDVVGRVARMLPADAFVLSFEPRALREVGRVRPELRTIQHLRPGVWIGGASEYAWGVGFRDGSVTAHGLAKAGALGLETTVYTVNDAARMRELVDLGVGGIFTDRPDLLRRVLDERRDPTPAS
jgi:glycerophosphoryl diester phosphodiesterase